MRTRQPSPSDYMHPMCTPHFPYRLAVHVTKDRGDVDLVEAGEGVQDICASGRMAHTIR